MRKVIASVNVSLDGFMAGPNCELDWHFERWGPDLAEAFSSQLRDADTILLGRVTYCAMASYWPQKAMDLSFPLEDIAFADMMNQYSKVVFSSTLQTTTWANSRIVRCDLKNEILTLKRQRGRHMIIYGSSKLLAALMQQQLIDEYVLWVHPVLLGNGKPLFKCIPQTLSMNLLGTRTFHSGVVMLNYQALVQRSNMRVLPSRLSVLH